MLMLMRRLGGDLAFLCPPLWPAASAVEHRSPGRRSPDGPPTDQLPPPPPREPDREPREALELPRDSEPE